jgi:hypothetical protein
MLKNVCEEMESHVKPSSICHCKRYQLVVPHGFLKGTSWIIYRLWLKAPSTLRGSCCLIAVFPSDPITNQVEHILRLSFSVGQTLPSSQTWIPLWFYIYIYILYIYIIIHPIQTYTKKIPNSPAGCFHPRSSSSWEVAKAREPTCTEAVAIEKLGKTGTSRDE